MNEHLRPLTLSEILDRTAQLYRSRFLVFLGISTIPAGVVFVFAAGVFAFIAWMGSHSRNGASVGDVFVWVFLVLVAILVVPASLGASALGEAAMSEASARMFLGENITIRSAYKNTWWRGFRFTGLYALQGLVIVAAPAIVFFTGIVAMIAAKVSGYATNDRSLLFGSLVFLLFVILGAFAVWMLLRFCPRLSSLRGGTDNCMEGAETGRPFKPRNAGPHPRALPSGLGPQLDADLRR